MSAMMIRPPEAAHGGTALGAHPDRPRHFVGNALHAVKVFAVAAADVVIFGSEGRPF